MNHPVLHFHRHFLWIYLLLIALPLGAPVRAADPGAVTPKPGNICPDTDLLLIVAEELSASLDLVTRSRAALLDDDRITAISELTAAGATLHLAASRGAAARTALLIDATVQAKAGENYTQMLEWIPLLRTSLMTLQDEVSERAVGDLIRQAESSMQDEKHGNPLTPLKEARHMLECDGLDIPLQVAMQARNDLLKQIGQGASLESSAYDALIDSLRSALSYTLEHK